MRLAPFARFSRPLKWVARVITAVLVLAVLLAGAAVWTVQRSFPQLDGELRLPGLGADVTVLRDPHGIPQIYASTPRDLFMAQGYVHAQDRFWEMDFRRKTTAGRLSELFGASTLDVDKVVRTLGWRRTAEREVALLDPRTRQALTDYAAGVNAWMGQHQGFAERSLEYAVLKLTNGSYTPEPWNPVDSLAWLKAMAWDLRSNMDAELERAQDASAVPVERVEELFPGYPYESHRPIVTAGAVRDGRFTPTTPAASPASVASSRVLADVARTLRTVPSPLGTDGTDRAGIGSNSWVVSGAHTDTGKPLLANDPHLGPRIPSIWYQSGLHCRVKSAACPYDVVGYTFSGIPGVVIGHNDRVAWGFTNLGPDVTDLYLERTRGGAYESEGAWVPMETRTEEIKVAGRPSETLTVRSTKHGPIVSGVLGDAKAALPGAAAKAGESKPGETGKTGTAGETGNTGTAGETGKLPAGGHDVEIALRWTALDPGRTADALLLLDTAANFDQFRKAASFFEAPAQNMVYADVDGNIGYQAPGRIPIRAAGDGRWPARGWTGKEEWTGYIPFDELPMAYNPPEGFIATANNAAIGPSYSHYLTSDWAYGYRSQRIVDRITQAMSKGKITVATMGDIQTDTANGLAPLLVPYLLKAGAGVPEARELLTGWDFSQGRDSAPAAYFNAVWRHLLQRTFDDELPEGGRPGGGDRWYEVVRRLLDRPGDRWWDDVRTKDKGETRDDMLVAAMGDAAKELRAELGDSPRDWRWGDLHTLELTNETFGTSGIGPIEWLFNRGPLRLGGGKDAVDATGWNASKGYQVDWVPSMRMIADMADLDRSRWVNLTGASGHAFHGDYDDQAQLWADGGSTPMRQTEPAVRKDAVNTLTLVP
ncbi:penicillin acylase family protein [Sphaerisporangium perillae]|uniref:penicillin acylase family protein n=1 Tax=Sphaerisporangium perillae TaxID=2935860 RepID=UPI00200BE62C|nr:penicillin acylase family protein [Sphaerisporangium perillae]